MIRGEPFLNLYLQKSGSNTNISLCECFELSSDTETGDSEKSATNILVSQVKYISLDELLLEVEEAKEVKDDEEAVVRDNKESEREDKAELTDEDSDGEVD
jgi:hypothetical protein